MQKKAKASQNSLEINGVEYKGLSELSKLSAVKGELEAGYPGGSETISDGQVKWAPIEGSYLDMADSDVFDVLHDLFTKNELADLTYIERDAHNTEIRRWLIPDAECTKNEGSAWNAEGVEKAKRFFKFVFDSAILQ